MYDASSEQRNRAFIEHARRNLLVVHGRLHMNPGATVFTLIPCLASSPAAVFVIMIRSRRPWQASTRYGRASWKSRG
jgi:hypothetical protein